MKAVTRFVYGSPKVLQISDKDKPIPKENEILIRVYATTVSRTDCALLRATPFVMRFISGLIRPRQPILGTDFAGVVEEVGNRVTKFKRDDKVWGFDDSGIATQAEWFVFAETKAIALIPDSLTFEQAAACAEGAHYAYNFINKVTLVEGQRALVNGATGAIGSALVQLLKHHNIRVTAVCRAEHTEQIRSLGAERVIDYMVEDFTKDETSYDFVFDAVGKSTFFRCKGLLADNGIYISSELGPYMQNLWLTLITPIIGGRRVKFPAPFDIHKSVDFILSLIKSNEFRPLIDKTYSINEAAAAYAYVESGQKVGNVILLMNRS